MELVVRINLDEKNTTEYTVPLREDTASQAIDKIELQLNDEHVNSVRYRNLIVNKALFINAFVEGEE